MLWRIHDPELERQLREKRGELDKLHKRMLAAEIYGMPKKNPKYTRMEDEEFHIIAEINRIEQELTIITTDQDVLDQN